MAPFIMNPFRFISGASWATALTDWLKRKEITINGAAKTADETNTFTSDNWTHTDGTATSISGGSLTCIVQEDTSDDHAYQTGGFTALSENAWVWRFNHTISSITHVGNPNLTAFFGLSQDTVRETTNNTFVGLKTTVASASGHSLVIGISATPETPTQTIDFTNGDITAGANYYFELIKNGNKYTMTIYADSDYSEVVDTVSLIATTAPTSLDNMVYTHRNTTGGGNAYTFNILQSDIYNGVTTVENIPSQQTVTTTDDFTASGATSHISNGVDVGGWITNDFTKNLVNGTNDNMDFSIESTGSNDSISRNLGFTASNTWVFRFSINYTTIDQGAGYGQHFIGLSDSDYSVAEGTSQNFIGTIIAPWTNFGAVDCFGAVMGGGASDSASSFIPVIGEEVYYEIAKTSSTTYTVNRYSDSTYLTISNTISGNCNSANHNLDEIALRNTTSATGTGTATGTIDNILFYNGIGEVNPATLTDYPLPIKIIGDADLQEKTTETFDEDFTTDDWTDAHANIGVNTTTKVMDFNIDSVTTDYTSYIDLTSVSDTKWFLQFKLSFTTLTAGANHWAHFGLGSVTGGDDTSQDWLGLTWQYEAAGSGQLFYASESDASTVSATGTSTPASSVKLGVFYITMIRTSSTTYQVNIYADSAHKILIESLDNTITATIDSLRYLKVMNNTITGTGVSIGTIDDVKFWDGITNPVNQEVATFTEAFTSTGTWSATTANLTFDTATDEEFDWNVPSGTTSSQVVRRDMGLIDPKHWVLRCMWEPTSATANSDGTSLLMNFGFSDSAVALTASQDSITWQMNNSSSTVKMGINNIAGNGIYHGSVPVLDASITAKKYYIELSRDGDIMTGKSFTDAGFSVQNGVTQTKAIASGISDLRYLIITEWESDGSTNGTFTGHLDDIQFWNGISTVNAEGRKIVFTDNAFEGAAVEYASETTSYDPINGDWTGYVKIPSLATGADTTIQMYYDYAPSVTPSYAPDVFPATLDDDFTSYADTTAGDLAYPTTNTTDMRVNPTVDLDFNSKGASGSEHIYYATDLNASDDKWILRFKQTTSASTLTTSTDRLYTSFGLSSTTTAPTNTHDFIGVMAYLTSSAGNWYTSYSDGGTENGLNTALGGEDPENVLTRYIQITRLSSISFNITMYSDSGYTTEISTHNTTQAIPATVSGLKYLHFSSDVRVGTTGEFIMQIDDIQFWNGISTFDSREEQTWNSNYKAVYHLQGNSTDSTVYGNDGTDTAVVYEQQNNSVGAGFNGDTSTINIDADSSLTDIWLGGGEIEFTINPKSDGENNDGRIFDKGIWSVLTTNESSGFVKLYFGASFSGSGSAWLTTNAVIPLNELTIVKMIYNADDVANDPIFIINGIKYTLGNGIDLSGRGTGTYSTDSASLMYIGNVVSATRGFDGFIDNVKASDVSRPSSEAITSYNAEKSDSDITTVGSENTQ